jgi:hypothetical protein
VLRPRLSILLLVGVSVFVANPALACEPVVPFMQVMVPALALSGSILVLAMAVVLNRCCSPSSSDGFRVCAPLGECSSATC